MTTPRHRGFLLIDVMVAGAIAAVGVASVLPLVANARAKNVAAARDVIASQLVLEKIEQVRSLSYAAVADAGLTEASVANVTGTFTRVTTTATAGSPETVSGTALPFIDVTVTVTYSSNAYGTGLGMRATQATTRIYQ
jgi:Tfp pilus assembly protein PilV